jgi:hypothetical protein
MDYLTALQSLMSLFMEHIKQAGKRNIKAIKRQLQQCINQQASYIKVLFADLCWES